MAQTLSADPILRPLDLRDTLRQMLAVLEDERHALAGLDVDAIMGYAACNCTSHDFTNVGTGRRKS